MAPDGRPRPAAEVAGRRVVAFAGIARPERFRATLEALGAEIREFIPFPDHHAFGAADLRRILDAARNHPHDLLLTTEKDLARLAATESGRRLEGAGIAAIRIEGHVLEPERAAFRDLLLSAVTAPGGGR
jgi:tetraacyldisaccharide 4'-kinase